MSPLSDDRLPAQIYAALRRAVIDAVLRSGHADIGDLGAFMADVDERAEAALPNLVVLDGVGPESAPVETTIGNLEDGVFNLVLSLTLTYQASLGIPAARARVAQYLTALIEGLTNPDDQGVSHD